MLRRGGSLTALGLVLGAAVAAVLAGCSTGSGGGVPTVVRTADGDPTGAPTGGPSGGTTGGTTPSGAAPTISTTSTVTGLVVTRGYPAGVPSVPQMSALGLSQALAQAVMVNRGPGRTLAVTTYGSGTCPLVPMAVTAADPARVEVSLAVSAGPASCTADLQPATSTLPLPAAATAAVGALTVTVRGTTADGEPIALDFTV